MKYVPAMSLLLGCVLLVFAAFAAFGLWIDMSFGRTQLLPPQPPTPSYASSLSEATSLEGLRKACLSIAQTYDLHNSITRTQSAHISYLTDTLFGLLVGGGIIFGLPFLYIYFVSRKLVATEKL